MPQSGSDFPGDKVLNHPLDQQMDQSEYYHDSEGLPGLHISDIPPALRPGIVPIILAMRARAKNKVGEELRSILYSHVQPIESDPKRQKRIARMLEKHFEQFPEEPQDGFVNSEAYLKFTMEMNHILASERAIYNESPLEFYPEDPEIPGKKQSRVLVECADGRNSPAIFMEQKDLLNRYAIEWLPVAGLIIAPELQTGQDQQQMQQTLQQNSDLKTELFNRLDLMFGPKVRMFKQRKMNLPDLYKLDFEFQSHFHGKEFPHHGCGAHCSDFNLAQAETIKNCFLLELWLKERYPAQLEAGYFRIYRTGHDTGEGGNVYSGPFLDQTRVTPEYYAKNQNMFEQAQKFLPPKTTEDGVFLDYKQNHLNIEVETHDEQVVRISQTHFAHTLIGQSVLEISWTNNAKNIFSHLKVLLGIIEKNYRKNHPEKPAIIHLDLPAGRPDIQRVFEELRLMILSDLPIMSKFNSRELELIITETDQKTLESKPLEL